VREDRGLEWVAAGGDGDVAFAGVEVVDPDPVELGERPPRSDVLPLEVWIMDAGGVEQVGDDGFDDCGEDADRDVSAGACLGPVEHGSQTEEVLHHSEPVLHAADQAETQTTEPL
jgi:hypothetical protein